MSIPAEIFNVLDYEADPTGTNDSASAIQSALNAAIAALGGTVNFPPGEYIVKSTINGPGEGHVGKVE